MHDQWTDRLSDYLDGALADKERQAVDAHLLECAGCTRMLNELREIIAAANTLPSTAPAVDLWSGISARIDPAARLQQPVGRSRRGIALTLPQLAAASVLLVLLSGWLATRFLAPRPGGPVAETAAVAGSGAAGPGGRVSPVRLDESQYDAAVAELQQALNQGRGRLDPATVATVEDNLRIIDAAVDEARRALATDPGNRYLTGHLAETRLRKLALLRRATAAAGALN